MSQASPQVAPPQAPLLQWFIAIPLLYVLLTMSAMLLVTTTVAGLRAYGKPVSERLENIRALETQLIAGIPSSHPVRFATATLDQGSAWIGRYGLAINKMASNAYLADVGNAAYIVLRRGAMAFGLLAPLLVILVVAVQDGLAQRELRKFGNDPESSMVYHTAKSSVSTWIGLVVAGYLLIPTALHPHVALCVLAPICGYALAITVTKYKKYL